MVKRTEKKNTRQKPRKGSDELTTLYDLLVDELNDLYDAEKQLVKALPKVATSTTNPELKAAIENHLEETRGHVQRLENAFVQLEEEIEDKSCKAMEGLVEEGEEKMEEHGADSVIDAAIIASAQKIEHYEIAGYGCVATWARRLGNSDVADLLEQTLQEEKKADEKLTDIGQGMVNEEAEVGSVESKSA